MRVVVFGAGGIGGVIGGQLYRAGHQVELIARGEHRSALERSGLTLELPDETLHLAIPVVGDPAGVDWGGEPPLVLLAVKSQDTDPALEALSAVAPPDTPVACAQNGVENERRALRRFAATYAVCVMCPATHLAPGVVQAHSAPVTGLLDLGRFPAGVDDTAHELARALNASGFDSKVLPDVMRWKYTKLLKNLANAVEALCGPPGRGSEVDRRARAEGEEVLRAAGLAFASEEEDAARRGTLLTIRPTRGGRHRGGSSWQSLERGTGSIEADYLNGEIALLGRLHGVDTPVNELLARTARRAALERWRPGTLEPSELLALL